MTTTGNTTSSLKDLTGFILYPKLEDTKYLFIQETLMELSLLMAQLDGFKT
jgi:hypothetical protein